MTRWLWCAVHSCYHPTKADGEKEELAREILRIGQIMLIRANRLPKVYFS